MFLTTLSLKRCQLAFYPDQQLIGSALSWRFVIKIEKDQSPSCTGKLRYRYFNAFKKVKKLRTGSGLLIMISTRQNFLRIKRTKNGSEQFTYIYILKGSIKPRFFLGLQLIGSVINVEKYQSTSGTELLRYRRFKVLKKKKDRIWCFVMYY